MPFNENTYDRSECSYLEIITTSLLSWFPPPPHFSTFDLKQERHLAVWEDYMRLCEVGVKFAI